MLRTSGVFDGKKNVGTVPTNFTNKQSIFDFFYYAGILVASALVLLIMICSAELLSMSAGSRFFRVTIAVVSVLCFMVLMIVLIFTFKKHYWTVFLAGITCDVVGLCVLCIAMILCIYASPYARGLIFLIISYLSPMNDVGTLQSGTGILPSMVVNDSSLIQGYATLTLFAQTAILKHQSECNGKQFIVANFNGVGMAALMHYYGIVLARAMEENKIFAWGDTACSDFFGDNCRVFFMNEHNCIGNVTDPIKIAEFVTDVTTLVGVSVPSVFRDRLAIMHPSMTALQLKYWWRTQSATYLMRLNPQAQADINAMRADPAVHPVLSGVIPPQTINIQMRRGDKYDEMGIPSVQKYIDRAEQLFNDMPFSYSRWVFITGDELESLQYADQLARERNWGSIYSIFPRMGKGFVMSKIKEFGWNKNVTLANLMDLDMSKDCSAWIGTRTSGWSRLFDEFRCTKVPKCPNVYIEIGSLPSGKYSMIEI
jgi:hypothetical protein